MSIVAPVRRISALIALGSLLIAGPATGQALWTPAVDIDNSINEFSGRPSTVFDSAGHIHVNWMESHEGDYDLIHCTNRPGYWAKSEIPRPGANEQFGDPRMVITPDDVLHVFFAAYDSSGSAPGWVWYTSRPAAGGSWSTPQKISGGVGANFVWAAVDSTGGIYMVWTIIRFDPSRGEIMGRYKPLGGSWGSIETIRVSGYGWPADNWVSADGTRFHICYATSDYKPYMKTRYAGGTLSPERTLNSEGAVPKVVANPVTGDLEGLFGYDWGLWTTRSTDGGVTWETPTALSVWQPPKWDTGGHYLHRNGTIAVDANGDVHVIWQGIVNEGNATRCYYRSRIRGSWRWEYSLSDAWSLGSAGADPGSLVTRNADVHAMIVGSYRSGDLNDIVYMKKANNVGPDTTPPPDAINLTATPGNTTMTVTWTQPSAIDDLVGTMVRYKTTGYPTGPTDGTLLCTRVEWPGAALSHTHTGLTNGVTYYYSAFTFDDIPTYAPGVNASAIPANPLDFDRDGDIDLDDFGHFQTCMTGQAVPQPAPECLDARLDADQDVDVDDLDILYNCMSGADVYAAPACGT